jgi:hypothetical protein
MHSIHEQEVVKVSDQTWLDSPAAIQSPVPSQDVTSHASPPCVVPTNKKYQCPACFLDNNPVGFGRKSDFKKHLHNFHGADVVWICRTKGCHLSYATERAYSTHAKETHRMDALPNSAAKTELCPQVVFSCGFSNCKERLFEAPTKDDSGASRDKYFEHIAKHFEDGFDVNNWEYRVQIGNLMRQQRVKSIWKNCIWPKEKRQQLVWRPRSSGDLRRMLECRHLGEDISTLVRLAFILGTPPFTSSRTPPPSEIDLHFQLPYRSQCLIDAAGHGETSSLTPPGSSKSDHPPTFSITKPRTSMPQAMLSKLGGRVKRESRPTSSSGGSFNPPADATDSVMREDPASGPHPGTPFPIPNESPAIRDGPKFAPDATQELPKQLNTPDQHLDEAPMGFQMQHQNEPQLEQHHHMQQAQEAHHQMQQQAHFHHQSLPPQQEQQMWPAMDMDPMVSYVADAGMMNGGGDYYECALSTSASTARPATPVPSKRPASWGKIMSMEALRPKKRADGMGSDLDEPIPAMPSMPHHSMYQHHQPHEMMNASIPMGHGGFDLPMRMSHEPQHHAHHGFVPEPMHIGSPTTFFFDDAEARM